MAGDERNSTLFIDASSEFIEVTNSNKLTTENIEKIVATYTERAEKKHFSCLVANASIAEQDYNISVSTYVEQEDKREVIDITTLNAEIREIVAREQALRDEIERMLLSI